MNQSPPGWETLFTAEAAKHLSSIEHALEAQESSLAVGTRLRSAGVPGDEVAALLTQAELRRKGKEKFGSIALRMLFTQAGLEQASRSVVTALHAKRFADAGCRAVIDLGCGIGSESMALIAAGIDVRAVEIDPFTARIAEHNLSVAGHNFSAAAGGEGSGLSSGSASGPGTGRVVCGDAEHASLEGVDGAFLDPARRTAGHRNTKRLANPDDYSPSLNFAFGMADRLPTGVKLGPGFDRELLPDDAEAQWISIDGQLVETGVWFGSLRRPGITRAALVLRAGAAHELTAAADSPDVEERDLGEYLYEPDGAVIRARLIGKLAADLGAGMVSEGIAYLTSDSLVPTPFAQAFRIIEQLPSSEKHLKRSLSERGIGKLEIKKRGTDVDPADLRRRLKLKGQRSATLFLTRVAGKHTALLAERV